MFCLGYKGLGCTNEHEERNPGHRRPLYRRWRADLRYRGDRTTVHLLHRGVRLAMTEEQLARFRALIGASISDRAALAEARDDGAYVEFLRGWNAGLAHAIEMLERAIAS